MGLATARVVRAETRRERNTTILFSRWMDVVIWHAEVFKERLVEDLLEDGNENP
jgi:hypothetical protein